jgi:hypothetical protein
MQVGDLPQFLGFRPADLGAPGTAALASVALPFVMQHSELAEWCWAATASSLQAFYGDPGARSQCEIASYYLGVAACPPGPDVPANPNNRPFNPATGLGGNLAAPPIAGPIPATGPAIPNLTGELAMRRPVAVVVQWATNATQHCVVVSGYDAASGDIMVCDPLFGQQYGPYDVFLTSYPPYGGHWAATLLTRA